MLISCKFKKYPTCISVCGVSGAPATLDCKEQCSHMLTPGQCDHWTQGGEESKQLWALATFSPLLTCSPLSFPPPSCLSPPLLSSFLGNGLLSSVYSAGSKWLLLDTAPSLPTLFVFACLFTLDCSPSSSPGYILSAPSRVQPFPGSCPPPPKAGISVPPVSPEVH